MMASNHTHYVGRGGRNPTGGARKARISTIFEHNLTCRKVTLYRLGVGLGLMGLLA